MANFVLRPARETDFDFFKLLHRVTMKGYVEVLWGWDDEWQEQAMAERFRPEAIQIIEVGQHPAGIVRVEHNPTDVFLASILLMPEHQSSGIGTGIVTDLMAKAEAQNVPMTLSVLRPNRAKLFYERLGFEVTGSDEVRFFMRWCPGA